MRKVILLLSYFFLSFTIIAQDSIVSGKVLDASSGKPLVSASIYFNKNIGGSITNIDGDFTIKRDVIADSIIISYIGYITRKYGLNNVPQKIYLDQAVVNLFEVVIIPGYANKIVKQIWDKYYDIYEKNKKMKNEEEYTFFYRQTTKSDTIYNEFIESFFTGNNSYGVSNLKLQKGRYAKSNLGSIFSFSIINFFQNSQVRPFHHKNPPKKVVNTFVQPNADKIYDIEVDKRISSREYGDILVLSFTPKNKIKEKFILSGKLHVRESDLSIIRFEGSSSFDLGDDPRVKNTAFTFRVNYREVSVGCPIVETVNYAADIDVWYSGSIHKAHVASTLFVVNQPFDSSGKKMKNDNNLIQSIDKIGYDSKFWKNNPVIKRTKVEEEVIRSFENRNVFGTYKLE